MVGRYRALLIGNSTYAADAHNLQPLRGPVKDIAALHAALVDRGSGLFADDDVTLVAEVTSDRALRAMSRFFAAADRDDVCLLYFSGHGKLDQLTRLHLCMQDTDVTDLLSTAVSSVRINEFIEACRARTVVVVLDCCHAGAFRGGDFGDAVAGPGRYVMTSCRSTQLANDATSENGTSYFTQHLVDGLLREAATDDEGFVRFSDLYTYVNRTLRTEGKQIPQQRVAGDGELRLARRDPDAPRVPVPRPQPPVRVEAEPRESSGYSGPRRKRTAVVGGVLAVCVAAAVITTLIVRGSGGSDSPAKTPGSGTYTATGSWRLRMDATAVDGCKIGVTDAATGESVPLPIDTVYNVVRFQMAHPGLYKWQTNNRECKVTEFAGSGNATLPFLQEDDGDTDAFTAPPAGVPVTVVDDKGGSNCTLRLYDATTAEELDVNAWKTGNGPVTLNPNGRQSVYVFDDNCVIRVGA